MVKRHAWLINVLYRNCGNSEDVCFNRKIVPALFMTVNAAVSFEAGKAGGNG